MFLLKARAWVKGLYHIICSEAGQTAHQLKNDDLHCYRRKFGWKINESVKECIH